MEEKEVVKEELRLREYIYIFKVENVLNLYCQGRGIKEEMVEDIG